MPSPANMQKLERASSEETVPKKKAIAFVSEVIVIEVPAFLMPSYIRFSTESSGFVWSRHDEITKQSSTPMPISKKGSKLWMPADFPPTKNAKPFDAANESPTQSSAMPAAADRK